MASSCDPGTFWVKPAAPENLFDEEDEEGIDVHYVYVGDIPQSPAKPPTAGGSTSGDGPTDEEDMYVDDHHLLPSDPCR